MWLTRLPALASGFAVASGLITLTGYAAHHRILATVQPGAVPMTANTALLFVLSGVALWLVAPPHPGPVRRRVGQALAVLTTLTATAILLRYVTDRGPALDLLMFESRAREWSNNGIAGRMSPHTGLAFILVGLATALLDAGRRHRYARIFAPTAVVVAGVGLTGRAFGLQYLYGSATVTGMAINTAVTFMVLSIGLVSCRVDRPLVRLFAGNGLGGTTMRRLIPVVVAAVLLSGVLFAATQDGAGPLPRFGVTVASMILVVTLCVVVIRTGKALNGVDRDHQVLLASLRDEHAFNRAMLEALPEGVIAIDPGGTVLQVNDRWCEITGFTERDAVGCVPPYPWWPADGTAEPISKTETRARLHRADGTDIEVVRSARPVLDADGGIRMVVGTVRDTTAQRHAADDQARLAGIVDSTDDAIISETLDGIITSWNPAAERIYGFGAGQAIGQSIRLIFGPEHDEILHRIGRGEAVTNLKTVRVRADGANIHIGLTVSPIRAGDGTVVGAASIARDITAHHRAEERFRRLVQAAPDAIMIADADGTIVLVNKQVERLFGYPAADLIGRPVELLMPVGARGRHRGHRAAYLRNPSVRPMAAGMELCGLRRDGSEFPIEISLAPLDTDQGALVSTSIRDVSVQRQIERDLAAARDDALAASQIKSQFVATVSHEIRTPMSGVIGLTALLLKTPLEATQRRYAEAIRASGRALLSIINDILDFSKIESGKVVLREEDFVLDELVEEVVQVAAEAGRDKDLQIHAVYPPQLRTRVRGDEGRLRQVLLNLLGNAVKFTEEGEVLLRVRPADDKHPLRLTFTVADTGIGITPADIAGIFEPFSQVDGATDREFGGTGLGLSICDQLVKLMGGHLDAVSEPGRGSRFSFTITLTSAGGDAPTAIDQALNGRRLMVIDGNEARRAMMAEYCAAWGLSAATAPDGRSALAELAAATSREQPYEVAVLDQRLPDMPGADLATAIAADPAVPTPILILLTSGSHQDEQVAIAAGAAAALPKPIGPSQLYNGLLRQLAPRYPRGTPTRRATPTSPTTASCCWPRTTPSTGWSPWTPWRCSATGSTSPATASKPSRSPPPTPTVPY